MTMPEDNHDDRPPKAFTAYESDRPVRTVIHRDGQVMTVGEIVAALNDQAAELKAGGEILDKIQETCGEGWWTGATDWRVRLRDFACDREQHQVSRADWELNRGHGVTLYAGGGFFTAYFDDAAELWQQADDTLPMFHVMMEADPPHRTCIHPMHLVAWVEHLTETRLPVQFISGDDLEPEQKPEDETP